MENMENYNYPSVDSEIIERSKNNTMSFEEAVADVVPFAWTDDVISGKKKAIVD